MHPSLGFLPTLRIVLVTLGVLVWAPYLIARYLIEDPFPAWWVLVVHVPCMLGALGLRIWQARR